VWATVGPEAWVAVVRAPSAEGTRIERRAAPAFPQDLAFTPDGRRLLVTGARDKELVLIDPETGRELSRLRFGSPPRTLAVSPDGQRAAVFLPQEGQVVIVRLTDGSAPARESAIPIPAAVVEMLWTP
jgi:DNA-binding beta-propeller fold protein YncE